MPSESDTRPWLLLVHQIPPKPDYFRAKIGRRLQRVGAVAIKNSVYVLPKREETFEDFQWVLREIVEGGGEAMMCEAQFVDGLSDDEVRKLFQTARDVDYRGITKEARSLLKLLPRRNRMASENRVRIARELAKLRRRMELSQAMDFFEAPGRSAAQTALAAVHERLRAAGEHAVPKARAPQTTTPRGRIWVTRRDVHVDRIASAWLIRRFIDGEARFKFVDPAGYTPEPGELRFDMYEAEYTHEGDACTFETLLERFGLDDRALRQVAEIVHDVDLKDNKYGREEAPGVARMIAGIAREHATDDARIEHGGALFETLYVSFRSRGVTGPEQRGRGAQRAVRSRAKATARRPPRKP
jgi:hypothetical protein